MSTGAQACIYAHIHTNTYTALNKKIRKMVPIKKKEPQKAFETALLDVSPSPQIRELFLSNTHESFSQFVKLLSIFLCYSICLSTVNFIDIEILSKE